MPLTHSPAPLCNLLKNGKKSHRNAYPCWGHAHPYHFDITLSEHVRLIRNQPRPPTHPPTSTWHGGETGKR